MRIKIDPEKGLAHALRIWKQRSQKESMFKEARKRKCYFKPSELAAQKKAERLKNIRKYNKSN